MTLFQQNSGSEAREYAKVLGIYWAGKKTDRLNLDTEMIQYKIVELSSI